MKRGVTIVSLAVVTLLVLSGLPGANAATIAPGGSVSPSAESQALQSQIAQLVEQLNQAKSEKQQLLRELQELNKAKPVPPAGGSAADTAAYQNKLAEWQAGVNALKMKITNVDKTIKMLEAKIRSLQQQKQNLQKALSPVR